MRSHYRLCNYLALCMFSLVIGLSHSFAARFGMADQTFNAPRFTERCYPTYCFFDNRGGLVWSFVNFIPNNLTGANDIRLGGLIRTTQDGVLDQSFAIGPGLQDAAGVAVQSDGKI